VFISTTPQSIIAQEPPPRFENSGETQPLLGRLKAERSTVNRDKSQLYEQLLLECSPQISQFEGYGRIEWLWMSLLIENANSDYPVADRLKLLNAVMPA